LQVGVGLGVLLVGVGLGVLLDVSPVIGEGAGTLDAPDPSPRPVTTG
jgi:hypothetical protein